MIVTEIYHQSDKSLTCVATLELDFPIQVGDLIEVDIGGDDGISELEVFQRKIDATDHDNVQLEIHARKPKKP